MKPIFLFSILNFLFLPGFLNARDESREISSFDQENLKYSLENLFRKTSSYDRFNLEFDLKEILRGLSFQDPKTIEQLKNPVQQFFLILSKLNSKSEVSRASEKIKEIIAQAKKNAERQSFYNSYSYSTPSPSVQPEESKIKIEGFGYCKKCFKTNKDLYSFFDCQRNGVEIYEHRICHDCFEKMPESKACPDCFAKKSNYRTLKATKIINDKKVLKEETDLGISDVGECPICLEEDVEIFSFFNCKFSDKPCYKHRICKNCYKNLQKKVCPECRADKSYSRIKKIEDIGGFRV